MKCTYRNCDNEVQPSKQKPNKKYCTIYCNRRETRLLRDDKGLKKLKDKYYKKAKKVMINNSDCKYCKDSNHTRFCSDEHQRIYDEIMAPIKEALDK